MERLSNKKLTEIRERDVLYMWSQNDAPVSLYIHNPFCRTVCKFCAYRGMLPQYGDIETYYRKILPRQLCKYSDIIRSSYISSCFFGGGTPSLISPKDLKSILNMIPNFSNIREKFFEIHPAYTTLELLDVLAEYKFNNIILGLQSFDSKTLLTTNRPPVSENKVKFIIEEIHKRGMFAWLDIVGFINCSEEELGIFINDIRKACLLQPDEISICPNFYYKHSVANSAIRELNECLKKLSGFHLYKSEMSFEAIKFMYERKKAIRLVRDNSRVEEYMNYIDVNDRPDNEKQAILGIGSFENENRDTFSLCRVNNKLVRYVERIVSGELKYYFVNSI